MKPQLPHCSAGAQAGKKHNDAAVDSNTCNARVVKNREDNLWVFIVQRSEPDTNDHDA